MEIAIIAFMGFCLDLVFGDPYFLPHPIRFIGLLISSLEKLLRNIFPKTDKGELAAGAVLAVLTCVAVLAVSSGILWLAGLVNIWFKRIVQLLFCYQIFACKSLKVESMKVYEPIEAGDLSESRKRLSMIVGRDTENLDFEGITKAVVETVAENTSDGVIGPMLFMLIGGAPLAFVYKAINTMDSMIGYKNDKYLYFGRAAARLDDLVNLIPARITGLAMVAVSAPCGLDGKNAVKIFRRDRKNHSSPNSAHPESACAGALGVQLGGDACYFGKRYAKQTIGDALRPVEKEDIKRACRLMYASSALCLTVFEIIRIGIIIL